jgi:hypothetical protein
MINVSMCPTLHDISHPPTWPHATSPGQRNDRTKVCMQNGAINLSKGESYLDSPVSITPFLVPSSSSYSCSSSSSSTCAFEHLPYHYLSSHLLVHLNTSAISSHVYVLVFTHPYQALKFLWSAKPRTANTYIAAFTVLAPVVYFYLRNQWKSKSTYKPN